MDDGRRDVVREERLGHPRSVIDVDTEGDGAVTIECVIEIKVVPAIRPFPTGIWERFAVSDCKYMTSQNRLKSRGPSDFRPSVSPVRVRV